LKIIKLSKIIALLLVTFNITALDVNTEIKMLLEKLGAGIPKKEIKYFDATFFDLNGKEVKISDYSGKVIFLNLWATWCPPCRKEMPEMEKLNEKFKDKNFVMIAVSVGEDNKTVKNFLSKNKYKFPIFTDNKRDIETKYSTGSIPTTYIIDKNGNILAQFIGAREWYSKEAISLIEKLL